VAYVYVEGKFIVTANTTVSAPEAATTTTRRWIAFDATWCRTCRVCETMCAIVHEGAARPALARIHVTFEEFARSAAQAECPVEEPAAACDFVSASVCLQCADAPCVEACPSGSLSRDAETGAILVDVDPSSETACIGCMRCRTACPWDVPQRHPELKVAIKCDLCAGRESGPACVEMCPLSGKALRVAEEQEVTR
jgi:Fe-S-cluster-containing dehydrogenase component